MDPLQGNQEINEALQQFEAKQAAEAVNPNPVVPPAVYQEGGSRMVKVIINHSGGAIKDERQAEYVLLGMVIVFLGISFYLFFVL